MGVGGFWWLSPQKGPPPEVEFGETVEGQKPPSKPEKILTPEQLVSTPSKKPTAKIPEQKKSSADQPRPSKFPDTEVGRRLEKNSVAMVSFGEGVEERYQASLEELRKNPEESIKVLKEVYQNAEETQYFGRWKLVHTMSAIQDKAALAPLSEIAVSPIPPEKYPRVEHAPSSTAQESHIRVTALDGLAYLARNGQEEAEGVLLQSSRDNTDRTIRRRAIRGYLAAGDNYEERETKLKAIVPEEQHDLIHLDVTPISEMPQPKLEGLEGSLPENLGKSAVILRALMSRFAQTFFLREARAGIDDCDWSEEFSALTFPESDFHYLGQGWCQQFITDYLYQHFGIEPEYWSGKGWNYPCDLNRPLGRVFNTLWVLFVSTPQPPTGIDGNILEWGFQYAAYQIKHLRNRCSHQNRSASNFGNGEIYLYLIWFENDIIWRAGNLIHEARHNLKGHGENECKQESSCDPNWEHEGSNTYDTRWLWWFGFEGINTTQAMKDRAKIYAQFNIDWSFNKTPNFTIE